MRGELTRVSVEKRERERSAIIRGNDELGNTGRESTLFPTICLLCLSNSLSTLLPSIPVESLQLNPGDPLWSLCKPNHWAWFHLTSLSEIGREWTPRPVITSGTYLPRLPPSTNSASIDINFQSVSALPPLLYCLSSCHLFPS